MEPVMQLQDLWVSQSSGRKKRTLLRGVNLNIYPGQRLGLVGESGSGKSVTAQAALGLLPGNLSVSAGRIRFQGQDLTCVPERERRAVRGRGMALVFQDYSGSLHPLFTVGRQMTETLRHHLHLRPAEAREAAHQALDDVHLPAPRVYRSYPHELSGGQRQRVALAMALMLRPALLIADEPTTALDPLTAHAVLDLILEQSQQWNGAVLLITHDLDQAARRTDQVAVMYGGTVVEIGPSQAILQQPLHPYTQLLLQCRPRLGPVPRRLPTIPGEPGLIAPAGCPFALRCPAKSKQCAGEAPRLQPQTPQHEAACHLCQAPPTQAAAAAGR